VLLALCVCAFAVVALVVAIRIAYAGEALPGTVLGDLPVGGASENTIHRRLASAASADTPVVIIAGRQRLSVKPSRAGYSVQVSRSVDRAMDVGRSGLFAGAFDTLRGLVADQRVGLVARVEPRALDRTVRMLAGQIDRPAFPGAMKVYATTGEVKLDASRPGRTVDRRGLRTGLRRALLDGAAGPVEVAVRPRATVPRRELEELALEAAEYIQQPLVLSAPGGRATISRRALARLLALEPLGGGTRARIGVNDRALRTLVDRVATNESRPARPARLIPADSGVVIDEKDDLAWRPKRADVVVRPSRAGRAVDRPGLSRSIRSAVRLMSHQADLPMRSVPAAVTTAQARRATWLIGAFTTYYDPGQPRVKNIRRIASVVDGTVILPGRQFSLNGVSGRRTRTKGYVAAPFIADGKIVPSVGGGVSQFSTTMYNAAYFAGLRIDRHQPHSVFIDRYPAGREATLNYPNIDLRWTNDTDAPVFVRASSDATSVTVRLYGDNGGRRVRAVSGPRQTLPGGGFAVVVTRVMQYRDGRLSRQPYATRYEPLVE